MIKYFSITPTGLVPSDVADSPVLVFVNPDVAERQHLQSLVPIDDHSIASALDPDEVSRVEFDPDYLFVIWKRPTNYSGGSSLLFDVASVGIILVKDRLIIVLPDDLPMSLPAVRYLGVPQTPVDALFHFLYDSIHHYLEHLKVIKVVARELQQRINTSMENENLIQMFNLSESLVYYLNALNGNTVVITRLRASAERLALTPRQLEALDDIMIEAQQCYRQAEIYSNVYSGLMDARGSLVNNNMNLLLRNLTLINVVFLPLNLLASIGGMSEYSMMTQGMDWKVAYSVFLAGMVILGVFTAFILGRVGVGSLPRVRPMRWSKGKKKHGKH
jgi:magnesium transporter